MKARQLCLFCWQSGSHLDFSPQPDTVCLNRKLKKLLRELKNKGAAETAKEEEGPPQQWNLDYALAPFEGLTPEYMEMSEFAHTQARAWTWTSQKQLFGRKSTFTVCSVKFEV